MTRLLVIQTYVPNYRVPFFAQLRNRLTESEIELVVAAGRPTGNLALRGDDAGDDVVDVWLPSVRMPMPRGRITFRSTQVLAESTRPDLVIVEQALKHTDMYQFLAQQFFRGTPRVGMWGQGRSFSTRQSRLAAAAKKRLTRASDWFFAYTDEGARHVIRFGFPSERVTVVQNSTDTEVLRTEIQGVSDAEVKAFRAVHGLTMGRTALFLGGVDASKGIGFLVESARKVEQAMPGFRLLIAGDGQMADFVRREEDAGAPIRSLGSVQGAAKAVALRSADVMMVPQWIGLVAVDALAAGLPIVTTNHPSHSPEFAYLTPGRTALVSAYSVEQYAETAKSLLDHPEHLRQMQDKCKRASFRFSTTDMASRMAKGIVNWHQCSIR